ncbi:glutathione S-transferase 1 [Panicum virgatum]|uniref:glutathione transferase n=1 Tax=Panicum virgatum TaxID=38727 RepID=A0A8T0SXW4_PANVG|nr:glutathione S-transferase 1 [Panicum virgatum]KAG2600919.1 hypothetical protein PVAP13_5KG557300 [Panicum virgatum]
MGLPLPHLPTRSHSTQLPRPLRALPGLPASRPPIKRGPGPERHFAQRGRRGEEENPTQKEEPRGRVLEAPEREGSISEGREIMAPMKLYGATMSWNVTRCVVALEEAGADYEIVPINFATAEHKSPEHLARNPFGQVPALQDGDLYVWESRAICKYAARKNKPELLKQGNLEESAMVDVWMEVEANQYTSVLNPILFQCLISPMLGGSTDLKVVEENLEKLKKVLEVYEARLTKYKYLAGDFLSLADLNHVSATLCLFATPHASVFDGYPHVKAWWSSLMERPSVQKVAALMKPSA